MKKQKRCYGRCLWALVLCFALAFGYSAGLLVAAGDTEAYKDTADQKVAVEMTKELITLAQVRELSRARGAETRQANTDLNTAQANKDVADMSMYDALGSGVAASIERALASQDSAITSLEDAKATAEAQKTVAEYAGEKLFFDYLQLQDSLVILDYSINLSREQLKIEELKARLGLSTATEVQKKQLALENLEDKRRAALNGVDMTGRSLLRQMGKDDNLAFRLDPAFSIEGMTTVYDPDKLAETAVRNNLRLGVLNRNIDLYGTTISSGGTFLPPALAAQLGVQNSGMAPSALGQIGAQRDTMILNRDNLVQGLRLQARAAAIGLDSARAEMALLEKSIEEKQAAYEVMSLQVSLGMAPRIGLQAAEMELLSAKGDLLKAQQNYYLSLRRASLLAKGVAVS
ncbi:MAG: TolC family protein [Clostridiales bacterium]|nr:TolC family protein [Clostridiales bacterium]